MSRDDLRLLRAEWGELGLEDRCGALAAARRVCDVYASREGCRTRTERLALAAFRRLGADDPRKLAGERELARLNAESDAAAADRRARRAARRRAP